MRYKNPFPICSLSPFGGKKGVSAGPNQPSPYAVDLFLACFHRLNRRAFHSDALLIPSCIPVVSYVYGHSLCRTLVAIFTP